MLTMQLTMLCKISRGFLERDIMINGRGDFGKLKIMAIIKQEQYIQEESDRCSIKIAGVVMIMASVVRGSWFLVCA